MNAILIVALACTPPSKGTQPVSPEIVAQLRATLQTGSLIFSDGDCLAVKVFSQSRFTHVGGVVVNGNDVTVYDSMNGPGVRKTTLDEYLRMQAPCDIHVVHPARPMTGEQSLAYQRHLDSQLGRKYAIKHHLTGKRADGVHCAEYLTDALMSARIIHAERPSRVSPGSLLQGLQDSHLCAYGGDFDLKPIPVPVPDDQTWCQRTWTDTVQCCRDCGTQLRRWVLCR